MRKDKDINAERVRLIKHADELWERHEAAAAKQVVGKVRRRERDRADSPYYRALAALPLNPRMTYAEVLEKYGESQPAQALAFVAAWMAQERANWSRNVAQNVRKDRKILSKGFDLERFLAHDREARSALVDLVRVLDEKPSSARECIVAFLAGLKYQGADDPYWAPYISIGGKSYYPSRRGASERQVAPKRVAIRAKARELWERRVARFPKEAENQLANYVVDNFAMDWEGEPQKVSKSSVIRWCKDLPRNS